MSLKDVGAVGMKSIATLLFILLSCGHKVPLEDLLDAVVDVDGSGLNDNRAPVLCTLTDATTDLQTAHVCREERRKHLRQQCIWRHGLSVISADEPRAYYALRAV